MLDKLNKSLEAEGMRAVALDARHLKELPEEGKKLRESGWADDILEMILGWTFEHALPETPFTPRSVIVVAAPSPILLARFTRHGRELPLLFPPTYVDTGVAGRKVLELMQPAVNASGHHIAWIERDIPAKFLAVCGGLGEYGRNNVCYVEGMGSFLSLDVFMTDIQCEEDHWRAPRMMERCASCGACAGACPTGAILEDRYLIRVSRCLTGVNEHMDDPEFPDWIPNDAHNAVVGCMRCQEICPVNKPYLDNRVLWPDVFTEEETNAMIAGMDNDSLDTLEPEFRRKIESLGTLKWYLRTMRRNLLALLREE